MQIPVTLRKSLLPAAVLSLLLLASAPRAHAVSKEIVQLQTQVQQLLDEVQRLQSTLDAKMGVLQNLAQQTADEANQTSAAVSDLQKKLNAQNDATSGKLDTVSGQMQSLNDSVDELKARIAKLEKNVQDMQTQIQNMQPPPQSVMGAGATPTGTAPANGAAPGAAPDAAPGAPGTPGAPTVQQAPPLKETVQAGERDYQAGRYKIARGEFQDVVHYYPLDNLAGTADFYLGEIAYQQKDYATAISNYNQVLEGFSGNAKAPTAQLHKAYALLAEKKHQEGIDELRSLIRRYPQTPEARAARARLSTMGARISEER